LRGTWQFARIDQQVEFVTHSNRSTLAPIEAIPSGGPEIHTWWQNYVNGTPLWFPTPKSNIKVVDLFCGPGGLSQGVSLGLKALGNTVENVFAADIDEGALRVFAANHRPRYSKNLSVADLVQYRLDYSNEAVSFKSDPELLSPELESLIGQVDLLVAGPPCQGHSTANQNRRYFDYRNLLYLTVPAIAVAMRVPTIIIENVPGVTASQQGVVQDTWKILKANGYHLTGGVIDASTLGWPQRRRRHFTIASKLRIFGDFQSQIAELFGPPMPISTMLADLEDHVNEDFMTEISQLTKENLARINFLHDNDIYDLPDSERNLAARTSGTTYRSVYGRMHWDKPAQTITTGFMTPGRGRYVHSTRRRTITPREAARLQGFPDTFQFGAFGQIPTRTELAKWIGDAVPTPLGFAATLIAFD
jgi:DNA (cytosine-5)-methyltransferase 1